MCDERLKEIRALTEEIPNYNRIAGIDGDMIELYVEQGYAIARDLFKDHSDRISIVRTTLIEGTVFELHSHGQTEIISVYEGTLILTVNNPEKKEKETLTLNAGDVYKIKVGIPHTAYCEVKTKIIVQIIPAPKLPDNGATV